MQARKNSANFESKSERWRIKKTVFPAISTNSSEQAKHGRDFFLRANERDGTGQNGARNEISRIRLVLEISLKHHSLMVIGNC